MYKADPGRILDNAIYSVVRATMSDQLKSVPFVLMCSSLTNLKIANDP